MDFPTVFAALLTPTVAVLGIFIAYRQWRLAQNKFKLDLFDRRFAVFVAARNFISQILTTGEVSDLELTKFLFSTREAKWLLSSDLAEYLDKELYEKAVDLQRLGSEIEQLSELERSEAIKAQVEVKKWFIAQHKVLDDRFSPYLKLAH